MHKAYPRDRKQSKKCLSYSNFESQWRQIKYRIICKKSKVKADLHLNIHPFHRSTP